MRILFTFIGGHGHFLPLVALARAASSRGHTVAFGCSPALVAADDAAGFTALPLGAGTGPAPTHLPLRPLDAQPG